MAKDEIFKKRRIERNQRKEANLSLKPNKWLVVCEGEQTEPNYFEAVIAEFNKLLPKDKQLDVRIEGEGKNTVSLVEEAIDIINHVDKYNMKTLYGKVFIVFDKDSFKDKIFNEAVELASKKGFIPLWSNEAIEFWFLLHFNYIVNDMSRKDYQGKLNEYFKNKGFNYKYQKNDPQIYEYLCQYGSLEDARKYALKRIDDNKKLLSKPAKCKSTTMVYKFFDELDNKLEELK